MSVEKKCKHHGITEFVLEGRGYYRCKKCRVARVAAQRRKNKQILVDEHGGKCSRCPYDKCVDALAFHHRNPAEKSFGISFKGRTVGLDVLREEAKKCDLLCLNCHAEVEAGL